MRTSISTVAAFAALGLVMVGFRVFGAGVGEGGLRELEGVLQPPPSEACAASDAECGERMRDVAIDVRGAIVKLSLRRELLRHPCASGSTAQPRLRAYGDFKPEELRMTLFELEIDCGDGWSRFERFVKRRSAPPSDASID